MAGWKTAVGEVTALGYSPQDFFKRIQSFDNDIEMIRAPYKRRAFRSYPAKDVITKDCLGNYRRSLGLWSQEHSPKLNAYLLRSSIRRGALWQPLASLKELNRKVIETLKNDRSLSTFENGRIRASLRDVYALLKRSHDDLIDSFEPESWTDVIWKARYPALIVLFVIACALCS